MPGGNGCSNPPDHRTAPMTAKTTKPQTVNQAPTLSQRLTEDSRQICSSVIQCAFGEREGGDQQRNLAGRRWWHVMWLK